jgi:hypothetical protein
MTDRAGRLKILFKESSVRIMDSLRYAQTIVVFCPTDDMLQSSLMIL